MSKSTQSGSEASPNEASGRVRGRRRSPQRFWETAEFRKLSAEWDARLAQSGFEDLEWGPDKDSPHLRYPKSNLIQAYTPEGQEYWYQVTHWLQDPRFGGGLRIGPGHSKRRKALANLRRLWRLYADGVDFRTMERITGITHAWRVVSREVRYMRRCLWGGDKSKKATGVRRLARDVHTPAHSVPPRGTPGPGRGDRQDTVQPHDPDFSRASAPQKARNVKP